MPENFERRFQPQPPEEDSAADVQKPESQNPEVQQSPKQRLFMAACNERLDELVKLDMLPEKFAEERRQSAALIEDGFAEDPEEQGREFAEIGLEGISAFRRAVDEAEEKSTTRLQPYLELVHDLVARFEAAGQPEKVRAIQDVLGNIETGLEQFRETAKQVKDLEIPFEELNKQIIDLEKLGDEIEGRQDHFSK